MKLRTKISISVIYVTLFFLLWQNISVNLARLPARLLSACRWGC